MYATYISLLTSRAGRAAKPAADCREAMPTADLKYATSACMRELKVCYERLRRELKIGYERLVCAS